VQTCALPIWIDFGFFKANGAINVSDPVTVLPEQVPSFFQQDDAADPLPARIGVREMVSDIAQVGRAKQGIADGMQQHIRIRMAGSSLFGGQFQSAHKKRDSFFQLMDVVSKSNSKIHFVPRNYTAR